MINKRTADQLVATAADAIRARPDAFHEVLEAIPAAIYVTDAEGTLTYYNQACVELAGRTPRVGADKWCVSWKRLASYSRKRARCCATRRTIAPSVCSKATFVGARTSSCCASGSRPSLGAAAA